MAIRRKTNKTNTTNEKSMKDKKKAKPLVVTSGKVTIGPFRSSFMRILQMSEGTDGAADTCSTAILIPKSDKKTTRLCKAAITYAAKAKLGENADPFKQSKLGHTLQDGDELYQDDDSKVGKEGEDHWLLGTKSYDLPKVVNRARQRVLDPDELKEMCVSGNYFNYVIEFKGYSFPLKEGGTKKGVRCEVKHVQFVKQGEKLDGSTDPEDEFEVLDEVDDEIEFEDEDD